MMVPVWGSHRCALSAFVSSSLMQAFFWQGGGCASAQAPENGALSPIIQESPPHARRRERSFDPRRASVAMSSTFAFSAAGTCPYLRRDTAEHCCHKKTG
jgi:hypothetical protein